jgi:hypothetical protein
MVSVARTSLHIDGLGRSRLAPSTVSLRLAARPLAVDGLGRSQLAPSTVSLRLAARTLDGVLAVVL